MSKERAAFPWAEVIGFGLGRLKLPPQQFWALTPRELSFLMNACTAQKNLPASQTIAELQSLYPDDMDPGFRRDDEKRIGST